MSIGEVCDECETVCTQEAMFDCSDCRESLHGCIDWPKFECIGCDMKICDPCMMRDKSRRLWCGRCDRCVDCGCTCDDKCSKHGHSHHESQC